MSHKPEIDRGGRVFLVEGGRVWEGISGNGSSCDGCPFHLHPYEECEEVRVDACHREFNKGQGDRILRPVPSGAVS